MLHGEDQSYSMQHEVASAEPDTSNESTATRHAEISLEMSSARHIQSLASNLPCPWSFPQIWTDVDTRGEKQHTRKIKTHRNTCVEAASNHGSMRQSHQEDWFHSLPFQQFQALLTLFSKSFSPFPHGTCLLSVSNQYLALDEIYHPICAPIPRNVTLRKHTVHGGLQMTNGTLTLIDALFQEAYICASVGNTSRDYNSRPKTPISMLSWSLFIRHYWGNPI